jgi:hypothetical protein
MKHLLNTLSEDEKNSIREQHTDKIKIDTSKFTKLMESKLGDVKPLLQEQGKALDGQYGSYELNTNVPGELSGNMQMGTFKIVK